MKQTFDGGMFITTDNLASHRPPLRFPRVLDIPNNEDNMELINSLNNLDLEVIRMEADSEEDIDISGLFYIDKNEDGSFTLTEILEEN